MKKIKHITILIFFIFCTSPKPKPRKPIIFKPISKEALASAVIYEANIRQYSNEGTFNAFAKDLNIIKEMGVKIIWFMPINPISKTKSKGPLGSYYAVSSYKKINPEFGTLEDFKKLVKKAHELGIYVIIDWVPGHTGWDHEWITNNDDYYIKNKNGDIIDPINPKTGNSFGWTDVADLNYDNLEMRNAMREAMIYWVKESNIDGFRIDQAYAIPKDFYDKTFSAIKKIKPVFLLAETDIYHPGGIDLINKFDASYDWPGHHLLKEIVKGEKNIEDWDKYQNSLFENYGKENILISFISNHDENSWNGTVQESFGKAAEAVIALQYTSPSMPLIYSGQEYDLNKRLLFFEKDSFSKIKGPAFKLLKKLGHLKNNNQALEIGIEGGEYKRIKTTKDKRIIAFQRTKGKDTLIFIANMNNDYSQFSMDFDAKLKRYQDLKEKQLSSSYQYDMKPWEFWILIK